MILGSMFAGIGGFEKAFADCGVQHAWSAESDATCNNVRRRHFPHETTVGDVRDIRGSGFAVDIVTAGWPCQGNSVAGRRAGMADERSGLWGEVVRVLAEQRPKWFLGENVPGILSVNGGRDFETVLGDLAELGYGFAYRVLNAEYFGVPQRRNRVFIVGCLGDWKRPAEVLFERESLPWSTPPRRETGSDVASTLTRGADSGGNGGYAGRRREDDLNIVAACLNSGGNNGGFRTEPGEHLVACSLTQRPYADNESRESLLVPVAYGGNNTKGTIDVATACNAHGGPHGRLDFESETFVAYQCHGTNVGPMGTLRNGNGNETGGVPFIAHTLRGEGFDASEDGTGRGTPIVPVYSIQERAVSESLSSGPGGKGYQESVAYTLEARGAGKQQSVAYRAGVRRLLPVECERLQGFPDHWTAEGADGKQIADGPRYRMIGNSVAVPVVRWIAERIVELDRKDQP